MRKPTRLALAVGLGALVLASLLWASRPGLRADDPEPWELYGGHDGYYIARGWTEGYSSEPLPARPVAAAGLSMPHTFYLPLVRTAPPPPPQPRETRALWVTRWDFKTASDIQSIVDKAAYAHLNTILFQVRGQADALYRPGLEPWSAVLSGTLGQDPGWDPLAEMIVRAHAKGLEVHAWINTYPAWLGTTPPSWYAQPEPMYHRFNRDYGTWWVHWYKEPPRPTTLNGSYLWASPGHPAVADRVVAVCKDLFTRYELDGLHFDYVRYNDLGRPYSYDPPSRYAYADALTTNPSLTYADWQRAQITGLLQRVRREVLPLRPSAHLTTSAWPIYDKTRYDWFPSTGPDGYNDCYQDSEGWARAGVVDGIMPMLYTYSVHDYRDRFAQLTNDFVRNSRPGPVYIGIEGDYQSFTEIAWRIETARAAGARGQSLFSYRLFDQYNHWQALRDGPYKEVTVPDWP